MNSVFAASLNARWRADGISAGLCLNCLVLPLSVVLVELIGALLLTPEQHFRYIESERGVTENATVLVALAAAAVGIAIFRARDGFPHASWGWFALVAAAGAFYFAGEEASWGQHLIGWQTPAAMFDVNMQNETNLHNVSALFGRIPKALLEIFMIVVGLWYPLAQLRRPMQPRSSWRYWLLPSVTVVPTCLLAIGCRLLNRIDRWTDIEIAIRWGEVQEFHIASFMLLYALTIRQRLPDPG